ncbi:hypothetical protein QF026_004811 [Streptomyces aurantiacus]|uniref:hypothetical protein n=1 Tax=Streptomyces aurantiacus TaxID=47760 RepID=UPI00278CB755|nr:hypothetical protein [Streptomyces aurantiacus]MDQ0776345.1 hypothetical protein [Streptomyces aurantiacus]
MTKRKQNTPTQNEKIGKVALIAAISIMGAWVAMIAIQATLAFEFFFLVYALPYLPLIYVSWLMLRNNAKFEKFRRLVTLLNFAGVGSIVLFIVVYYDFIRNFGD